MYQLTGLLGVKHEGYKKCDSIPYKNISLHTNITIARWAWYIECRLKMSRSWWKGRHDRFICISFNIYFSMVVFVSWPLRGVYSVLVSVVLLLQVTIAVSTWNDSRHCLALKLWPSQQILLSPEWKTVWLASAILKTEEFPHCMAVGCLDCGIPCAQVKWLFGA